jgi:hypothetical protein
VKKKLLPKAKSSLNNPKNFKTMYRLTLIFVLCLLIISCKKEAGEGGSSHIKGKVYAKYEDKKNSTPLGESFAPDERVFIIYGNSTSIGNDARTDYDGNYTFDFLHKGSYTIYVYSDCDTCASGVEEVKVNAEITKNRETVEAPQINITRKR